QRGASGGVRLARPASTITLGEVVRFLEQRYAITECFRADGGACLLTPRCRLKPRLAAAREAFLVELNKTTIAACAFPGPETAEPARAKTTRRKHVMRHLEGLKASRSSNLTMLAHCTI